MQASEPAATAAQGPRRVRGRRPRNGGSSVNPSLTVKPLRETAEVVAACRRMAVAVGRRVGSGDIDALAELMALSKTIDQVTALAVERLRQDQGVSWAEIALRTGTSRQAAQQRWGKAER